MRREVHSAVMLIPINSLPDKVHKYLDTVAKTDTFLLIAFQNSDWKILRLYLFSVGKETGQLSVIEDALYRLYIKHDIGEGGM